MAAQIQKYVLLVAALMLVGLVLAGLILAQATAGWHAAIKAGNEEATIQNLKTVAVVESFYFYGQNHRFGTFKELVAEGLLTKKFVGDTPNIDGYVLTLKITADPAAYSLSGDPESQATGKRHFYFDSTSRQIHVNPNQPAGPNDPLLDQK